ncbi:flagellar brake protein [Stenotrophomonas sp. HITSZ_GD]|jgi:flagellar brake protein|uniref:flagellar brake protein n=1 Tax=Stenotrophomonas sp. HITSZ_GD TaxID=3037248 RepID=UPI00240DA144|nr:flagellar brake protein [Stenotrophomonas sp. HITSZ_GD]MDG2526488.1 flagellar brake protein [Stenotrophomonas sp. HITSZ_GD]
MLPGDTSASQQPHTEPDEGEDRYLVRNPRQVRGLLRALIDQRSLVSAHIGGRDQSFPSAVLEVDEDEEWILLDGSPNEASNRAAAEASHLLCFAQLDRVRIRFRLDHVERIEHEGHVAFRAALPTGIYHLQRREYYRLETPITDSPTCLIGFDPDPGEDEDALPREPLRLRVIDISGGGLAVSLPAGAPLLEVGRVYRRCELRLPDQPPFPVALAICSQARQTLANGVESFRIGARFENLPRGADEDIQRYIFRIDRQRNARKSGVF